MKYEHTVDRIEIPKFMGSWYVWAGRTSFLEKGAFGAIEKYTWNQEEERIDIDFVFHKNSFEGKLKSIPQKAWIHNKSTNAHWKVQPFWPLKFDYLILAVDPNYEWTAIGVPNGAYLWIMGRSPIVSDKQLNQIIDQVKSINYPTENISRVPQR